MSARRLLPALILAATGLIGIDWLGGEIVASAIAHAPNSDRALRVDGTRSPPAPPDVEELVVPVGPPQALLNAWLLEPAAGAPAKGTIVLLHGVRTEKSSLLGLARRFQDAGYRAVLPDLRGHGSSSGTFLTYGVVESRDVVQLLDAIVARRGRTELFLFGYSYGGAVAIQAAARDRRIDSVVAVSTFASLREVVGDYKRRLFPALAPVISASWLNDCIDEAGRRAQFDPDTAAPARAAATLEAPLLLIHGTNDTQIPPSHAKALHRMARRSTLVLVDGETHASMLDRAAGRLEAESLAFFQRSGRTRVKSGCVSPTRD